MVGLMPNVAAGGASPAAASPAAGPASMATRPQGPAATDMPNGDERRATDEEKALFNEVLGNAMSAVYQEKTVDALADTLRAAQQAGNPGAAVEPLAQAVSGAVANVAYDGVSNGLPIEREMVALAAASLAHDLGTTVAEAAGVPPMSDEQVQAVYLRASELLADRVEEGEGVQAAAAGVPQRQAPQGNGMMQRPPNRRERRAAAAQERRAG